MTDYCAIRVVPQKFLEHHVWHECNRAPDMRKATVGCHESDLLVAVQAKNPKYADIHPVLEIVLTKLLGNRPRFSHGPDVEILSRRTGEATLRGQRRDPAEHGLIGRLQLHQHQLAVHGYILEVTPVRQSQIGVKLETTFAEAAKDTDSLFTRK